MSVYTILLFCTAIVNCFGVKNAFDKKPYYFFDSKTAYSFVRGKDLSVPENCQIQQIFMLCRHGTRTCSSEDNDDMVELMSLKNTIKKTKTLDAEDINVIRTWMNENVDHDKDLTKQGEQDMIELATSVKAAFGDIFKEDFDSKIHSVLASPETRAKESGWCFLHNAFDNINITELTEYKDDVTLNIDLIRTNKVPKGEKKEKNKNTQMTAFQNGPEMNRTRANIAKRLGLETVTFAQAKAMYESCRHETANRPKNLQITPAWCRAFSEKDLQVFEYLNDMSWYYKLGWGNPDGHRLGCPLLTRLNLSFKLAAQKEGKRGIFYFGHRDNLFVAITMLELFKGDAALTAKNMRHMKQREWRTSFINPFAANMIAAFYSCNDNVDRVSFFVNEKIMPIELDDNSTCTVCLWKDVEMKFDRITADKRECGFGRIITPP
ncbi:multiple inositol polyphosphate phosphatase 1-like [Adelges cooleyi]|uniref:multiple inositol polyphosphate phosphatase 1-like n=1 Tax=Adelges cooleyi TaxID=133065 RepID=UPI00217FADD2|nr:multiple inositol polyphosphate phosphatase 1-like [Adelges cooleyi]